MTNVKVTPLLTAGGNSAANQFELAINSKGIFFQSYDVIVAGKTPEGIVLDEYYWDYSRTTARYRNQFLRMDTKQIKKGIESGSIKLKNLN